LQEVESLRGHALSIVCLVLLALMLFEKFLVVVVVIFHHPESHIVPVDGLSRYSA
jgi:hypothetical protein